ncbi:MAG: hypothetical protein R3E31_11555 [Chloroflexota bacterium]
MSLWEPACLLEPVCLWNGAGVSVGTAVTVGKAVLVGGGGSVGCGVHVDGGWRVGSTATTWLCNQGYRRYLGWNFYYLWGWRFLLAGRQGQK